MAVRPIPEGYHTLTPYLAVEDAARAIEFYKDAFGAEETIRMPGPGGSIAHAELQIGDSKLMLSDPFPQSNVRPPTERGGPTSHTAIIARQLGIPCVVAIDGRPWRWLKSRVTGRERVVAAE